MFFLLSPSMIRGNWQSLFSSAGTLLFSAFLKVILITISKKVISAWVFHCITFLQVGPCDCKEAAACLFFSQTYGHCLITVTSELHPIFNISNYKKFSTAISLWWWEDLSRLELSRIWVDFQDMWPREEPNMIISSPLSSLSQNLLQSSSFLHLGPAILSLSM